MDLQAANKIALWNTIGVWLTGLATFTASGVALYLARRTSKVNLHMRAEILDVVDGIGIVDKLVAIEVTNLGERSVTITDIGWVAGRGKKRIYCKQTSAGPDSSKTPFTLAYGEKTMVSVSLSIAPYWADQLASTFMGNLPVSKFKTLRAIAFTSVRQAVYVKPSKSIIDRLIDARAVPPLAVSEAPAPTAPTF